MMTDRRIFESFALVELGSQPDVGIREDLAVALGRIGDPRGRAELEVMLAGSHTRIGRAAAFSLGQLGLAASWPSLIRAVDGGDQESAIWSVDALARSGADLKDVLKGVEGMRAEDLWPRLLPYLFRFPSQQSVGPARQALELSEPTLRAMAAYAIARKPLTQAAPSLRQLLDDPDPWVRGWAARALGQVGSGRDLTALRPLLDDEHTGPVVHALRGARQLIDAGRAAPPDDWRSRLAELMGDSRAAVSLTAIEASSTWLLDEGIRRILVRNVETGRPRYRDLALLALMQGKDPRGLDFVYSFVLAADPDLRALAARALASTDEIDLLEELFTDSEPRVRLAALESLLASATEPDRSLVTAALGDSDAAVVGTIFDWLTFHPIVSSEELSRAIADLSRPQSIETRLNGTRALVARGRTEPLERGLVVQNLESLSRVGDFPARRAAADGLVELGRDRPPIAPPETGKSASNYEDILLVMSEPRVVELETLHGATRIRLDCPTVPMTCLSFLQLTNQGFYDGLPFHRVVPDFVVQGGDPRGDGWGGPGYTIRDELNRRRFDRGVLGMASAGPDTAGSQFFITLSRQPHLDGRYTAFGEVTHGLEVLDSIVQGDRIVRLREVR